MPIGDRPRPSTLLAVYFGLNVMAKAGHPEDALKQAKDDALLGIRQDLA